jgi:anaerobic dimethyl sulfoxide reductase subunit A
VLKKTGGLVMLSAFSKQDEIKTVYTTCACNCGANHQCVIKAHVKGGKVIAVEPDDRYNRNIGREDEAISEEDLIKTRLQRRPCVMGLAFHRYMYHPDRILYPLKRAPGTKRGEGKYVRISWEEALDTIANKMKECREKYGPYSIITQSRPEPNSERLFSLWGAGAEVWGWCSYEAARLVAHLMTGEMAWDMAGWSSSSGSDMLANTKFIVLWGCEPTVGHMGPGHQFAWFIKMARERGKRVIIIDPRYTVAAKVLADQWIPIKPGTDTAMFLALAYVLFEKDLWNKEFVAKYVEPVGFRKWQDYVMGKDDGIPKTPEWAETICAVPAETIKALAMMIGTVKPGWLWAHWSISRKSRGEQTVKSFAALQAMMGYWGTPGAGPPLHPGSFRRIPFDVPWGPPLDYKLPRLFRREYWTHAILLLDKVRSGELSEKDYMRMVGWKADPALIKQFNPKMIFWGIAGGKPHSSDHLVTLCDSSFEQVRAMEKMEFICSHHSMMTPTMKYSDIILPARDMMWEDKRVYRNASYGVWDVLNYTPKVVEPQGEVKSWVWIYCKLAEKLGLDPKTFFKYYTTDENWERDWERYVRDCYQVVIDHYQKLGMSVPSWDEFSQGKFINCNETDEKPYLGWVNQIQKDKPFKTKSGKIEIYSEYVANEANRGKGEHYDHLGQLIDNLPGDWGDMTPAPVYMSTVRGMDDTLTETYPLMLLTPHSRYRVHYLFWEHNWLRNHVYRHRVWINAADAKVRGIKDGDQIKVFNERGKIIMPAYVTSRIMPGIAVIHAGGKFIPDEQSGADIGAAPSSVLGGDLISLTTPAKATNLVQIEKYRGKLP